jgi:UDP-N-acetylmuramate--alanine ligase
VDIYAASEKPIEGVSAETMVERIRQFGHRSAEYAGTMDRGVEEILEFARPGDLVLTLGAGNVWQAGDAILLALRGGSN